MPDLTHLELADLPAVVVETLPTDEQLAGTHAWLERVLCGDYRVRVAVYIDSGELAPMTDADWDRWAREDEERFG